MDRVTYSNYYSIVSKIPIYIYAIKSEPSIETHDFSSEDNAQIQRTVRQKLYGRNEDGTRAQFFTDHPTSLFLNQRVYSTNKNENADYDIGTLTIQEKPYKMKVYYKEELDINKPEHKQVIGRLIKQHIQKVRLIKYGRKFFDPARCTKFDNFGLSLMQGYDTSVSIKNTLVILQIDACVKVTRQETYLSIIKNIQQDTPEYTELVGGIVQVGYGNKQFYRIDSIDFEQTPQDTFETTLGEKKGQLQSYIQYYKERYGISIQNTSQPLLICKRKQRGREIEIRLIPELCHPTGETKEHKSNFQLQKDLGRVKHKTASEKLRQCDDFLRHFRQDQERNFRDWGIQISEEPLIIESSQLQAGSLQLQQSSVNIDKGEDLDRMTQAPMFQNPYGSQGLQRVLILYSSRSQQILDQFLGQFQQSVQHMKFPLQQPRCIGVNNDRQFDSWKKAILDNGKGAQMVFCILPGPKKKGLHYNELKLFFCNEVGLFSQMILESTIKNPKGLRTVCNKIILKITSKAGGVPYKITEIPDRFSKQPTMVCGIDIYHATPKYSVIGAVCSVDQAFGNYYSHAILKNGENDLIGKLTQIFQSAIDAFGKKNKCAPKNIVVYRDGVSDGQIDAVKEHEIQGMLQGIQFYKERTKDTKLTVILVNKRIKTKIYSANRGQLNSAQSPTPGTLVDGTLINESTQDFYLVSQKGGRQGVATPTHYKIIYNDLVPSEKDSSQHKEVKQDLQILTYKLCYLYYNCTHAIKCPSPARLAHRFTNYIGDKFKQGRPETFINPKPSIKQLNSLYFL